MSSMFSDISVLESAGDSLVGSPKISVRNSLSRELRESSLAGVSLGSIGDFSGVSSVISSSGGGGPAPDGL